MADRTALGNDKGWDYGVASRVEALLDESVISGVLTASDRKAVHLTISDAAPAAEASNETARITARGARNYDHLAYKDPVAIDAEVRLGEAVIEAFAAATGLLNPRVSNAVVAIGITFRDELRKHGFDIVPLLTDEAADRIWQGIKAEIAEATEAEIAEEAARWGIQSEIAHG